MEVRAWGDEAAALAEDGESVLEDLRQLEREAEFAEDFVGVAIIRGYRLDAGDPQMTLDRVTAPLLR